MDKKYVYLGVGALLIGTFALGRYTGPEKVRTETKIVEVEKKTKKSETEKHKETEVVEITHPDGTKEKKTKIVEDANRKTAEKDESKKSQDSSTEITRSGGKLYIQGLAGLDRFNIIAPIYGISISREILGPISVGGWGLSNGAFGVSLGLSF